MKKTLSTLLLFYFVLSSAAKAEIEYSQKDPSMARVLRLFDAEFTWLNEDDRKQHQADLEAVGYQDFPAFKRFLEDKDIPQYNNWSYQILISYVSKIDGVNICSIGDADLLRLTREFLTVKSASPDWQSAAYCLLYLSQKGAADDLPLLEKYSTLPDNHRYAKQSAVDSLRILQARVAGTNVLTGLQTQYYCWSTNEPPFLPSVANTGPQAAYVYDLLKQALKRYGAATNIPPELVTMQVLVGEDGRPVCSVELAKYGLAMPEGTLPPSTASLGPAAQTHADAAVAPSESAVACGEKVSPFPWCHIVIPLAALAGALIAVFVWRAFRNRKM